MCSRVTMGSSTSGWHIFVQCVCTGLYTEYNPASSSNNMFTWTTKLYTYIYNNNVNNVICHNLSPLNSVVCWFVCSKFWNFIGNVYMYVCGWFDKEYMYGKDICKYEINNSNAYVRMYVEIKICFVYFYIYFWYDYITNACTIKVSL